MYTPPLVKLGGDGNPFWEGTGGPTPVYADQFDREQVQPDPRLVNVYSPLGAYVHPPRYLHGPLRGDQLATMLSEPEQAEKLFVDLAGPDERLSQQEWQRGLSEPGGFLRGSEHWDEAVVFDGGDGQLTFQEAWAYLRMRRANLVYRFGGDDGKLAEPYERSAANDWLQQDLYALALAERTSPVKPAQPLGLINALLLAVLLTGFFRLRRWEGQVFALLVILYPVTRFVLEMVRADNPHNLLRGVLTHNQYTSLGMLAAGVVLYLAWRRLPASAGPVLADRVEPATEGKAKRAKRSKR
jgi:hypothetical protein